MMPSYTIQPPSNLLFTGSGDVKSIGFPMGTLLFAHVELMGGVKGTFCYRWAGPQGFTYVPDSELTDEQRAEMVMHIMTKEEMGSA